MNSRPDILLFLTDQWNPRMLGFQGHAQVMTPELDRLAAEGLVFDNAYTPCPVCMPARWSLATGLYPHHHGLWMNMTGIACPPEQITLFRGLKNAGYSTAKIGKFHYFDVHENPQGGTEDYFKAIGLDTAEEIPEPYACPWSRSDYTEHLKSKGLLRDYLADLCERFEAGDEAIVRPAPVPAEDHPDAFITEQVLEAIQAQPTDRPMFLCASLPGPHSPFDAPGRYGSLFDPDEMVLAPNTPERLFDRHDRAHMRKIQANYFGKLAMLDDCASRIVTALESRGNWDETLMIFSADHGEYLSAHNRMGKCGFHEESAGIPLLIRPPGGNRERGRHTSALASLVDVHATILDAAGADAVPGTFGRSLLPVLSGEQADVHEAVISEFGHQGRRDFMVRFGHYKWFIQDGCEQLYNLENDPWEMHDLIDEESAAAAEARDHLLCFLQNAQINLADEYQNLFTRVRGRMQVGEKLSDYLMRELEKLHFGDCRRMNFFDTE